MAKRSLFTYALCYYKVRINFQTTKIIQKNAEDVYMEGLQKEVLLKLTGPTLIFMTLSAKRIRNQLSYDEKEFAKAYLTDLSKVTDKGMQMLAKKLSDIYEVPYMIVDKKIKIHGEMKRDQKNVCAELAEKRKTFGIKQSELGTLFGVSAKTISRWENGSCPYYYREVIWCLFSIMDARNIYRIPIMKQRWVNNKTLESAAEELGLTEEELWRIEIENRCPLNILHKMSCLYHWNEDQIPIRKNDRKKRFTGILLKARKIEGLTSNEAADKYGITPERYKRIEYSKKAYPTFAEMVAIANYYKTTPEEIFLMPYVQRRMPLKYDIEKMEYYRKIRGLKLEDFLALTQLGYKTYRSAIFGTKKITQICKVLKVKPNQLKKTDKTETKRTISADKIKKIREQNGISQITVSKELGIKKSWLKAIENGTGKPSLILLSKIARLYGEPITYFYED